MDIGIYFTVASERCIHTISDDDDDDDDGDDVDDN